MFALYESCFGQNRSMLNEEYPSGMVAATRLAYAVALMGAAGQVRGLNGGYA